jgi:gluconate 2-dehydrogenase gamma chain
MSKLAKLGRRRFLGTAVAVSAATTGCTRHAAPQLSGAEMSTLTAICDQMIPPDQDPGGAWAGVANYISRQLSGPFHEQFEAYRKGLAAADKLAGGNFATVDRKKQLDILNRMDRDKATRSFIAMAATHGIQGFYGNPRHGGNRDYCSWRMLGIPASPLRGRDSYDFTKGGTG